MKKTALILVFFGIFSALFLMGFSLYDRNFISQPGDAGDAPDYYGEALHYNPAQGPYFGQNRGDDDRKIHGGEYIITNIDDTTGIDDEDAFKLNYTSLNSDAASSVFLPDVDAQQKTYIINITVNGAKKGDPVRGWIDFDGNKTFDDYEKASAEYDTGKTVTLAWVLPVNLHTSLTYARFRTCTVLHKDEIEYPTGKTRTGEVEDYTLRIIQPVEPQTADHNLVNFDKVAGQDSFPVIEWALNDLWLGDSKVTFKITGTIPSIAGINNLHEATVTGLRLGHSDDVNISQKPIVTTLYFSKPVEGLAFEVLDVDGGDRVKIEGFSNGTSKQFNINNVSDNFYTLYNSQAGEIHSIGNTDSGNDTLTPSSLDMAAEIIFNGYTDSVKLTYYDDGIGSSGTYTLGNITSRKWSFAIPNASNITVENRLNNVLLNWNAESLTNIKNFTIERSNNGISFEAVGNIVKNSIDTLPASFTFLDNTISPVQKICYYKIKTTATDNSINYSTPVRIRRNLVTGFNGFKIFSANEDSKEEVIIDNAMLTLLKDMPGSYEISLLTYAGVKLKTWNFENGKKGDELFITDFKLSNKEQNFVYLVNGTDRYMQKW